MKGNENAVKMKLETLMRLAGQAGAATGMIPGRTVVEVQRWARRVAGACRTKAGALRAMISDLTGGAREN